ncbi:MAG TPA: GNAT family protein [Sedimentisphaerales bacterium]|nr:GNAT family protein [Sedimentisphaerales bacterium]
MNTKIESEKIYLRSLELVDLDRIRKWHNDPVLYETFSGPFRYVSSATDEEWLKNKVRYSMQEINLAICLAENSQHIGNIYLRDINWVARHAELAIFIGEPDQRSKGYGQAAVRLLKKHAFEDLGLLRLYLTVLVDNRGAIRMYEKCGFVVEGQLRRHAFKQGMFKDVLIMGTCIEESSEE